MKYKEILTPEQLIQYMSENIYYGFVGKNGKVYSPSNLEEYNNNWYSQCIIQNGESLVQIHYGTCWDQTELEREWFNSNGYCNKTIFMWLDDKPLYNLPNHTFLMYEYNKKWYWFEHAFETHKGIHEFDSEEQVIESVKDKLLEYAIQTGRATLQDRDCIKCYEYTKPEPNLGVDDYIYHITHSMNKKK